MKKVLHFKIHPNILNIIRNAYWFEEGRKNWAMDCLNSLDGENKMSLDLAMKLLHGEAHFITNDNGKTLTAVFKNEPEFKKKVAEFIEEQKRKKEEIPINYEDEDMIEDEDMKSPSLLEMQQEADLNIAKKAFIMKFASKDPSERNACDNIMKDMKNKVYEFVFKSHQYTFNDSARNQSLCPHCDRKSKGFLWNPEEDKEAYLGKKKLNTDIYALCFECPSCFEKFYYHKNKRDIDRRKRK